MSGINAIDRRLQHRYHLPSDHTIITKVTHIGVPNCGADDIRFVNFSRSGLGLESEHSFPIGTGMQLDMFIDDGRPVHLKVVVNNRRKSGDLYCYGAFFEYTAANNDIEATRTGVEEYFQRSFDF